MGISSWLSAASCALIIWSSAGLAPVSGAEDQVLSRELYRSVMTDSRPVDLKTPIASFVTESGPSTGPSLVRSVMYLRAITRNLEDLERELRHPGLPGPEYARIVSSINDQVAFFAEAYAWCRKTFPHDDYLFLESSADALYWRGTPWADTLVKYFSAVISGYASDDIHLKIAKMFSLMAANLPIRDLSHASATDIAKLFLFDPAKAKPDADDVKRWDYLAGFFKAHHAQELVFPHQEDAQIQAAKLLLMDRLIEQQVQWRLADAKQHEEERQKREVDAFAVKEAAAFADKLATFEVQAASLEDGQNDIAKIEKIIKSARTLGSRFVQRYEHLPNDQKILAACGKQERLTLDAFFRFIIHHDDKPALALEQEPALEQDERTLFLLAYVYAKRSDLTKAEEFTKKLLQVSPENSYGRIFLEQLKRDRKPVDK